MKANLLEEQKDRMKRLLFLIFLAAALNSQNSPLDIERLMTPQELRDTGVALPAPQPLGFGRVIIPVQDRFSFRG